MTDPNPLIAVARFFDLSVERVEELLWPFVDSSDFSKADWIQSLNYFLEHEKSKLSRNESQLQRMLEYIACAAEYSRREIFSPSLTELVTAFLKENGFENDT